MTNIAASPAGISGRNRGLLTRLHRTFPAPFTVREAAVALEFGIPQTRRFLAYLAERGWLVRVHPGLYATVSLEVASPAEWREDPWVVATKLFGPDCYLGGWTACEHWELTDQLFHGTVVFTTRRVRSVEAEVQGFPFRVRRISPERVFGTRPVWRDRTRVQVSDPTHTVVDVLDRPSLGGGIRHVAEAVSEYFRSEHRDDELLVDYMMKVGNGAAYKRLGYLLEELDIAALALIRECREGITAGISMLDPDLPRRGPSTRRWNLRVNGNVG